MRSLRLFEEYLKEGIARKAQPDTERAKSLVIEYAAQVVQFTKKLYPKLKAMASVIK
jgi:hypothetical protein